MHRIRSFSALTVFFLILLLFPLQSIGGGGGGPSPGSSTNTNRDKTTTPQKSKQKSQKDSGNTVKDESVDEFFRRIWQTRRTTKIE